MSHSKKYLQAKAQVEARRYQLREAVELVREMHYAKFDETVEVAMRLGVDPRHADQMVRGTVVLPHGTGKSKRVLVIAKGDKAKEAQEAGADFVVGEECVEKIQGGWLDFDAVVATPDMMRDVGKLGKVLGPARSHAEPEGRHGHMDVAQGGPGDQGRQGRVPGRQDGDHPRAGRQDLVRREKLEENANALITRSCGPSRRAPRASIVRRPSSAPRWARASRWTSRRSKRSRGSAM